MATTTEEEEVVVVLCQILNNIRIFLILFMQVYEARRRSRLVFARNRSTTYSLIARAPDQHKHMHELVGLSDVTALDTIRMNRDAFGRLCFLLEHLGGLTSSRHVDLREQVAMFLCILAHHTKNVIIRKYFKRSTHTISKYFHRVLMAVVKLYPYLAITPTPATTNNSNERWNYFEGCLGALDGTHIDVRVPDVDKPRFRNRKSRISFNVLGVCDMNMNFVYLLSGWEGSAADSRVLRDAVSRPNGLKVPTGHYYLVDNGYTNGPGFLAPYRGVRYHLQDFGGGTNSPQNYKEYFNLKHAKARNVIERAFGILKSRWAILRSHSFYPVQTQNLIVLACALIHNFIRTSTGFDPEELNVPEDYVDDPNHPIVDAYIENVEACPQWTNWRDNLAAQMWNSRANY